MQTRNFQINLQFCIASSDIGLDNCSTRELSTIIRLAFKFLIAPKDAYFREKNALC